MKMLKGAFSKFFHATKSDLRVMKLVSSTEVIYIMSCPSLQVRFGDQLKIESIKTQGQFLHCSSANLKRSKFNVLLEW